MAVSRKISLLYLYCVTHLFNTCEPADINIIQGLLDLKGSVDDIVLGTPSHGQQNAFVSEKGTYHHPESSTTFTPAAATKAVLTLQGAEKAGCNLQAGIEDDVTKAGGWSE